jgi:MoaA/NifB/PqqE/SkfB family radical SAM enzyme
MNDSVSLIPSEEELRHWPIERMKSMLLEMGAQCNVRCSMCFQTDFSPATKLADIVWKERLLPAYQHIENLTFTGGEPTILANCRKLIEMIIRDYPQIRLDTATNGLLFKGFWTDVFLKQGDCVNFSINSTNPETYARVVQFGKYGDVINNIENLIQQKRQRGSKLVVRISTVVTDDTVDELPSFAQWAVDHGLDQVLYNSDIVRSISRYDAAHIQKRIAETYEIIDKNPQVKILFVEDFDWFYASLHKIKPVRERTILTKERKPCHVAFDGLNLTYHGDVRPCCKTWCSFGNLVHNTLDEVWNSQAAYRFRRRMLNLDFADCSIPCDLNANPINAHLSNLRRAYWAVKRDPGKVGKKLIRKLGLSNAQIKQP